MSRCIIHISHQYHLRTSFFQPIVMRTVNLNHFSKTSFPLTPLAVLAPDISLPLPKFFSDQPLPERLTINLNLVSLEEFLTGQRRTESFVFPLVQPNHFSV